MLTKNDLDKIGQLLDFHLRRKLEQKYKSKFNLKLKSIKDDLKIIRAYSKYLAKWISNNYSTISS